MICIWGVCLSVILLHFLWCEIWLKKRWKEVKDKRRTWQIIIHWTLANATKWRIQAYLFRLCPFHCVKAASLFMHEQGRGNCYLVTIEHFFFLKCTLGITTGLFNEHWSLYPEYNRLRLQPLKTPDPTGHMNVHLHVAFNWDCRTDAPKVSHTGIYYKLNLYAKDLDL